MNDRSLKSVRNILYGVGKQLLLLFLNFAAKTVFIYVFSKEYLGLNGVFNNIFLMFSFTEFGISSAMVYSFYQPLADSDHNKCNALYCYFKKLYFVVTLIIFTAGLLVIPFLPFIVDVSIPMELVIVYYVLYLINTCLHNLSLCSAHVLTADQNQYIITKLQMLYSGACFVAQILVLLIFKSFVGYVLCMIAQNAVLAILFYIKQKKMYPYMFQGNEALPKDERESIWMNFKTLFLYSFSKTMINCSDNVIISIMLGTAAVGLYSNYEFVIAGVWSLVRAPFSAVAASVGNLLAEKKNKDVHNTYKLLEFINMWICGFTSICLLVLFQDFITLWAGESYLLNMPVVLMIVGYFYLRGMRECVSVFRQSAGMFVEFRNITLITAALNIVLSFVLGYFFGMFGIFLATILAVLATYFWYEPHLVYKKLFKMPIKNYAMRQSKYILATFLIAALTYGIAALIETVTIGSFILKIIMCMLIPNLCYILLFFRTEEFTQLWQKGIKIIRGK